jgi:TM2 domain-containing membrane protein YozV
LLAATKNKSYLITAKFVWLTKTVKNKWLLLIFGDFGYQKMALLKIRSFWAVLCLGKWVIFLFLLWYMSLHAPKIKNANSEGRGLSEMLTNGTQRGAAFHCGNLIRFV